MIIPIIQWPNEMLRKVSKPYISTHMPYIVPNLFETLNHYDGLGLSAIQIGYPVNVFVLNPKYFATLQEQLQCDLIFPNVQMLKQGGEQGSFEGCLSIPNLKIELIRPTEIEIRFGDHIEGALQKTLKINGQLCCVFCHEFDHIQGRLITDYQWEI